MIQGYGPKVSALIVTYNHENYIARAVESALQQEVDFPYEIVVGDDCSTDNTRDILTKLRNAHPKSIRLLLPEEKAPGLPGKQNFVETLNACRGQYVAILDGDDYWTDPHKLQKQVAFLETHPAFVICFHNAVAISEAGVDQSWNLCRPDQQEISTLEDLLQGNFIPSCSVVFRNGLLGTLPDWFHELPQGDYPLHVLHASHGKIGYLSDIMAAYRVNPRGSWQSLAWPVRLRAQISAFEVINRHFRYKYRRILGPLISKYYLELSREHEHCAELSQAQSCARSALSARLRSWQVPERNIISDVLRLHLPTLYKSLRGLKNIVSRAP